jgi:hypothetical protein
MDRHKNGADASDLRGEIMAKREETTVILAYITVCIIWGSTYLAIRIGVSDFPPELFAGIRFLIAGALVMLFAYFKGYKFPENVTTCCRKALSFSYGNIRQI